jgi:Methyltransferase domain
MPRMTIMTMLVKKYLRPMIFGLLMLNVIWRSSPVMRRTTELSFVSSDQNHTMMMDSARTLSNDGSFLPRRYHHQQHQHQHQHPLASARLTIGALGPRGTDRLFLLYYDAVFFMALQYTFYGHSSSISSSSSTTTTAAPLNGSPASTTKPKKRATQSVLEVGCAADPFIDHFTWIPNKYCVAPYHMDYPKIDDPKTSTNKPTQNSSTHLYVADFLTWTPPPPPAVSSSSSSSSSTITTATPNNNQTNTTTLYDLVLCSQVVEHVEDPRAFVQKLLQMTNPASGGIAIISVPYLWGPIGVHLTHYISEKTLLEWSHPYLPIETRIVKEPNLIARLVAVYRPSDLNYRYPPKPHRLSSEFYYRNKDKIEKASNNKKNINNNNSSNNTKKAIR